MDMTGLPPETALPPPEEGSQQSAPRHWRSRFIECLAATSNLAEAAAHAGVSIARACQTRRNEPEFARQWLAALAEGYLFLELDLVRRLREGDFKGKDAERYDVANAIRLLAAHRDGLASTQSRARDVSAAEVRASIDRKIEDIRQRMAKARAAGEGA